MLNSYLEVQFICCSAPLYYTVFWIVCLTYDFFLRNGAFFLAPLRIINIDFNSKKALRCVIWQQADKKATRRTATVHCNRLRSFHRAPGASTTPYTVVEGKTHTFHMKSTIYPIWKKTKPPAEVHHHLFVCFHRHRLALLPVFLYFLFCHWYNSENGILAMLVFIYLWRCLILQ